MNRKSFLMLGCLMAMPLCGWGQAAAEYGLAASKSAAATAAVAGKLSADSTAAATSKIDRTLNRSATAPSSAPRVKRATAAPRVRPQGRRPTSSAAHTQRHNRPMQISVVGGDDPAKRQDRKVTYPSVIELAPSKPGAPSSKVPPK